MREAPARFGLVIDVEQKNELRGNAGDWRGVNP